MSARTYTTDDFKRWGGEGGRKSRRTLTPEQARKMVAAKMAKRLAKATVKQ